MHQIIKDKDALLAFIEFLPDTTVSEKYLIHLQARKKLLPSLRSSDKSQLKRVLSSKKDLYRKIKQLECPFDSFYTTSGQCIPTEAMVVYITPNPRCMDKAAWKLLQELAQKLGNKNTGFNPAALAMSVAHRSKSRSVWVDFDIDFKGPNGSPVCTLSLPEITDKVNEIVGRDAATILKTNGGCHVLVKPDLVQSSHRNWYKVIQDDLTADQSGDNMIPMPGCVQGQSIPTILQWGK